jgi:hypothetical protein
MVFLLSGDIWNGAQKRLRVGGHHDNLTVVSPLAILGIPPANLFGLGLIIVLVRRVEGKKREMICVMDLTCC